MNLAWRKAVLETSLPASVKITAMAIDSFANRDGYACPSTTTISRLASLDKKTVLAAIVQLEQVGLLQVERTKGGRREGNRYGTNDYRCLMANGGAAPPFNSGTTPPFNGGANGGNDDAQRWSKGGATPPEPVLEPEEQPAAAEPVAAAPEDPHPEPELEPRLEIGEYTRRAIERGLVKDMPMTRGEGRDR